MYAPLHKINSRIKQRRARGRVLERDTAMSFTLTFFQLKVNDHRLKLWRPTPIFICKVLDFFLRLRYE
jgi:hypothetical protein